MNPESTQLSKVNKPWGFYVDNLRTEKCVQKTIYVKPGHKLSLQYHDHRQELWFVELGKGKAILNTSCISLEEGDSLLIEVGEVHRIINDSKDWLVIHEMQFGECREEDIVRLEDDYER